MTKLKDGPIMWLHKRLDFNPQVLVAPRLPLLLATFFTLWVVWIQGAIVFGSGKVNPNGSLVFYDYVLFRDSTVHLSLIEEIKNRFPPTNFASSGETLKNYHYLYDTVLALVGKGLPISTLDLYFRIAPVLLSILLCTVIFLTTYRLSKNYWAASLAIFFTVMATSFGPIMPFVKQIFGGNSVTGGNNLFMTDQIYNMMVNPQGVLSLIIFLSLFLLLDSYERNGKRINLLFFSVLLGLSFGFKAYGGLVFLPGALVASLWFWRFQSDHKPLIATLFGGGIMFAWIRMTVDSKVAGIAWAPLWLVDQMMADLDRFNEPQYAQLKQNFLASGNFWRVGIMTSAALLLYVVGSLGIRLAGLWELVRKIKTLKNTTASWIFLLVCALASFAYPLVVNQTKKAYDVVQFTPYITLVMGILFTITVVSFLRNKPKLVQILAMSLVVIIFLLLDERDLRSRLAGSSERIVFTSETLAGINYVRTKTSSDAIFLLPLNRLNEDYLWFSGLSGRRTVYSGSRFAEQVGVDIAARKKLVADVFLGKEEVSFDYIFVTKAQSSDFATIEGKYRLKRVYENDDVLVLKNEKSRD